MTRLATELGMDMHRLGLETDQEEFIYKKVESASDELYGMLKKGESIEGSLKKMVKSLQVMAHEQERIISENLSSENAGVNENIGSDIELF